MRYMDKTSMGLEHYFSDISPVVSLLSEFSAEDTLGILVERPAREQNEVCRALFEALEALVQSDFAHKDLIPANVRRLADSLIAPDAYSIERLLPVFGWLEKLHIHNEQSRVQWISGLRDCAAQTDTLTAALIQNLPQIESQRVSVVREDGGLRIGLPEKLWGRISLTLPDAQMEADVPFPLFGYLFVLEASVEEERCRVVLLLDLEFSDTPYQERLLSDENWLEFEVTCGVPQVNAVLYDYTARALAGGHGHPQTMEICCEALSTKGEVLGRNVLSTEEHRLLLLAQLFCAAARLNRRRPGETFEWNVALLENRYALSGVTGFLEKQEGPGRRLSELLRMASDAYEEGQNELTMRTLTAFAREYGAIPKSLGGCAFAATMVSEFAAVSQGYVGVCSEQEARGAVMATVAGYLEETLSHLGFTGALPHFARRFGHSAHYLSFVQGGDLRISECGDLELPLSLSAARVPLGTLQKIGEEENFGRFFAEDFKDIGRTADFARLATEDDAGRAVFQVDFHDPSRPVPDAERLVKQLEYHVLVADCALKDQPIDKAYLSTLRRMLGRRRAFRRMVVPLLFSVVASVGAAAFWLVDNVFDQNYTKLTLSGFGALALIAGVVALLFTYWKHIRSIWAQ